MLNSIFSQITLLLMIVLKLAHESHEGVAKAKQLLREKVW
jgi:hypothetical protein